MSSRRGHHFCHLKSLTAEVSVVKCFSSTIIGATTLWDPWDASPPKTESHGTNTTWSPPTFMTGCNFFYVIVTSWRLKRLKLKLSSRSNGRFTFPAVSLSVFSAQHNSMMLSALHAIARPSVCSSSLSIVTKIDDLGWPWTAISSNFRRISEILATTTAKRMKIDRTVSGMSPTWAYLHSLSFCIQNLRNHVKFAKNSNLCSSRSSVLVSVKSAYIFINSNFAVCTYISCRLQDIDA